MTTSKVFSISGAYFHTTYFDNIFLLNLNINRTKRFLIGLIHSNWLVTAGDHFAAIGTLRRSCGTLLDHRPSPAPLAEGGRKKIARYLAIYLLSLIHK
jgi:hypothetical protein